MGGAGRSSATVDRLELAASTALFLPPAGWQRLEVADLGAPQVGYRYALIAASSPVSGEAAVIVFARGAQIRLAGAAALGRPAPVDAVALAHDLARRHTVRGDPSAYSSGPAPRPIPDPTRARRS